MFLLGLTFILYMVFGMIAMKVVNIPMYTTLRRTTVVFVMLLEWFIARKTSSLSIKVSVGMMIAGAMVAGVHDLNFDLMACKLTRRRDTQLVAPFCVIVCRMSIIAACSLLFPPPLLLLLLCPLLRSFLARPLVAPPRRDRRDLQLVHSAVLGAHQSYLDWREIAATEPTARQIRFVSLGESSDAVPAQRRGTDRALECPSAHSVSVCMLSALHVLPRSMFYNNLISIPLLLVIIWCTDETAKAAASPYWLDVGFLISLLASSSLAFVLNYAIFWNTAVNSALTQTVSGQAKDVVVVVAGFALFADAVLDPVNILGVTIGFAGSIFYAMTKIVPTCTVEHALQRIGVQVGPASSLSESARLGSLPFTEIREEHERESLLPHPSASSPESSPNTSPMAGGSHFGVAQKIHSPTHISANRN